MGDRRSLVVAMTVAVVVVGTATAAGAATGRTVAIWQMNESDGARAMIDSGGHELRGSIGREIEAGIRIDGATGYRFSRLEPDEPPAHPRHLVTVPDSDDLDPGDRDYTVTIRLRTTERFGNVIQKGQATVDGGNFKLQIPNGIVQCLFRGSSGEVIVSAPRPINNGRWHTARCDRTRSGLALSIDGSPVAHRAGHTGRIENSWPLSIGGKTDCDQYDVGCDYFAGDIDYVEIDAD
jgi:hypothetical protein